MNEVEFVLRRILREAYEYAKKQKEGSSNTALAIHRYTGQIQLLSHLEEQFLERNENDKQD
jgi:hypothetical protein